MQILNPHSTRPRVAVIGGGITGLAAGVFLVQAGYQVTVFEASNQFGGLGTFFEFEGQFLERFYHCLLPGDKHLLTLLQSLQLTDRVYWKNSSFGILAKGRLYGLNTPVELLRFDCLSICDRLRVGLFALYAAHSSDRGLDQVTAKKWLIKFAGERAFENFFQPLLQAKFGSCYAEVPALWFWSRFQREKGTKTEVKGYIRGGYKCLIEALVAYLQKSGVILNLDCPVDLLNLDETGSPFLNLAGRTEHFDQVLYTAPFALLSKITGPNLARKVCSQIDSTIDAQGVVNVVLLLRKSLVPHYWVATVDREIPFQGVVETTNVIDDADAAGMKRVYLMKYAHRTDRLFSRDNDSIIEEYLSALKRLFPQLRDEDVIGKFVFKAPFVETIYTPGYLLRKPPLEIVPQRVYLATTAQVYPDMTSWNGSTGLAQKAVQMMSNTRPNSL